MIYVFMHGFPDDSVKKKLPANVRDLRNVGSIPGSGRFSNGNPLQNILAWRIHGQRSLVGYSPWGHKESVTTEVT